MDYSVESRLKWMRKQIRIKDLKTRRLSLSDWRKEKRHKLVNSYRKIDSEWYVFDAEEAIDCGLNIGDNSKCVDILFEYLSGRTLLNEMAAKKCLDSTKIYFKDNQNHCEDLIRHQFCLYLSQFVSNPLTSNNLKLSAMDLIQMVVSNLSSAQSVDHIIKSGLILSVLINFNTSDIEILTKTVAIMQKMVKSSHRILLIALDNGYLRFLMKIIESTQVFTQRKSNETIKSKQLSEKKLNLIRQISESLQSVVNDLDKTDVIPDLYHVFSKLIHFKDIKIIVNALSSLMIIMERNPKSNAFLNRYLILSMTDLMSKNNENISSIVVHFWKLFNQRIDENIVNSFKSLLIESNLIKKLYEILTNVESNRLVTEVADFLSEIVDRFDNSFELMVEFDIYRSLIRALFFSSDYLSQRQVMFTINGIIDRIESYDVLTYLLEIDIFESLASFVYSSDPELRLQSSKIIDKILQKSVQFGLKDMVLIRAQYCSLNINSCYTTN